MNNKFDKNRKRNYIMVFGLLILSFLVVFGGLISRKLFSRDIPLVFIDANNKLMYITKSDNQKNDISLIDTTSVIYGNSNTKNLLYTNKDTLYLLDTNVGGSGKAIVSNPIKYGFSSDDKYIYYIHSKNGLYMNNNTNNIFISSSVNDVELVRDDNILFSQNNELVYFNITSMESVKVSDKYETSELNSDNKLILYSILNENNLSDYYVYNISTKETKEVLSNITKLYDKDSNYTKFIYPKPATIKKNISSAIKDELVNSDKTSKVTKEVELRKEIREYLNKYEILGDNVYYLNGSVNTLIASNINELYYYDIKGQKYSYSSYHYDNNSIDVSSYDNIEAFYSDIESKKLNTLYFKVSTNEESVAYRNITSKVKVDIRNDDEYYLFVENNGYYDLYYTKINNKQVKIVGQVDSNLISNKFNTDYLYGYLYCNYINNRYYLNSLADGRIKNISDNINPEYYEVSEGKDNIYFVKKTDDNVGDLILYNGIRNSKLLSLVHGFIYVNNDLMYVTKDYDPITKTSDLYRLSGNHLDLIYKNIADWYNPYKNISEEE